VKQLFIRIAPSTLSMGVRSTFSWGETSTFCLYFSGCWRCNAHGRLQSALLFLRKKKLLHFMTIVTKKFASLAVIARYIAISYKIDYLLIFKQGTSLQRSKLPW